GQPDGAVLEVVDEVLLGERRVVEPAVGPHRVVGAARRRVDRVRDVSPDVLGGLDAEGLHPVEALAGVADGHHLHPQAGPAGARGLGGGLVAGAAGAAGGEQRAGDRDGDERPAGAPHVALPSKAAALMPMWASSRRNPTVSSGGAGPWAATGSRSAGAPRRASAAPAPAATAGRSSTPRTTTSWAPWWRPRTSTRPAPTRPSGWGLRSIGRWAVMRSRRVAAMRAVTRLTPGNGGTRSRAAGSCAG